MSLSDYPPLDAVTRSGIFSSVRQLSGCARILLVVLFVCLSWTIVDNGPDYQFYMRWSTAAISADIQQLGPGDLSPQGVPFLHWSSGPGLYIAPVQVILQWFHDPSDAGLVAGFVSSCLFWIFFFRGLCLLTNRGFASFGVLLAAVATPLGYYSLSISSEAFSLLPAGLLFVEWARGIRGERICAVTVSAATSMLVMLRPHLGVYAWPALLLTVIQGFSQSRYQGFVRTCVLSSGIGLAIVQIGIVHRWMTGSFWSSPYVFRGGDFSSFDWSCPHLGNVLFDTFHGVFPTHPLVFIGVICAIGLVPLGAPYNTQSVPRRREKIGWCVMLLAVAASTYIQGCWYYWWLGENSFGMRGLVLTGIPAVAALTRSLYLFEKSGQFASSVSRRSIAFHLMVLGSLGCSIWSWLLIQQGPMDFLDWGALLEAQWFRILMWVTFEQAAIFAISVTLSVATLYLWNCTKSLHVRAGCGMLLVLVWSFLLDGAVFSPPNPATFYGGLAAGLVGGIAIAPWFRKGIQLRQKHRRFVAIAIWALMIAAFVPLYARTEVNLPRTKSIINPTVTYNRLDTISAYKTLWQIPRMTEHRLKIRRFLQREMKEERLHEIDRLVTGPENPRVLRSRASRNRLSYRPK